MQPRWANSGLSAANSTAQYWKPIDHWPKTKDRSYPDKSGCSSLPPVKELETTFSLHLAQAHSNKAPKGRKRDFADAERLTRRHIAGELILSFVPDPEQRLWRTMTRTRQQLIRDRVRLQSQLDSFLEEARIKLSSHLSDLLGLSGRLMLQALAEGGTDPAKIAALATQGVEATQEELQDALSAAGGLNKLQRRILKLFLERLTLLEKQIDVLEKSAAEALRQHQDAVRRLAEMPGLGAQSAQQIIAMNAENTGASVTCAPFCMPATHGATTISGT